MIGTRLDRLVDGLILMSHWRWRRFHGGLGERRCVQPVCWRKRRQLVGAWAVIGRRRGRQRQLFVARQTRRWQVLVCVRQRRRLTRSVSGGRPKFDQTNESGYESLFKNSSFLAEFGVIFMKLNSMSCCAEFHNKPRSVSENQIQGVAMKKKTKSASMKKQTLTRASGPLISKS